MIARTRARAAYRAIAALALASIVLASIVLASTVLTSQALASGADEPATLELSYLNGVYRDLDANLQPIRQGGIVILVSSPEHRLEVHGNRLSFRANGDGTVDAEMEVDFEGGGELIADVQGIGRFTDRVVAARQTARAAGTVRLAHAEGGYELTVVDAEPSTELRIRSQLADQVVGVCEAAALIPLISLPCDGIGKSLEKVSIPLPEPGTRLLVPSDEMSRAERAFFDRFVEP